MIIKLLTFFTLVSSAFQLCAMDISTEENRNKVIAALGDNASSQKIKDLFVNGLSPNALIDPQKGVTLLHESVARNSISPIVAAITARGGNVNARNKEGFSPLDLAVVPGRESRLITLVCGGAHINDPTPNKLCYTPLMRASCIPSNPCVKLLLAAGADYECTDSNNSTAYEIACNHHNTDTAELLAQWDEHLKPNTEFRERVVRVWQLSRTQSAQPIFIARLPKELMDPLLNYFKEPYKCDVKINPQIIDGIKQELGLQRLPLWVEELVEQKEASI